MKKLFVSYDIGLKLKNKGFKLPCYAYFDELNHELRNHSVYPLDMCDYNSEPEQEYAQDPISAPTYDQVRNWLEETYDIQVGYLKGHKSGTTIREYFPVIDRVSPLMDAPAVDNIQEALNIAITQALKLIP